MRKTGRSGRPRGFWHWAGKTRARSRFGESLLGKETYWQKASGRRAATRPDTDVVELDVQPEQDKG